MWVMAVITSYSIHYTKLYDTGNYDLNKTYSFTLDKSAINAGGKLSLVVTHVSGNDISFASKETVGKEPVLKIEMSDVATWLTKEKTSMVKVSPNPFNDFIKINSAEIVKQVMIMDMTGKQMKQMDCNVNDLFISTVNLPVITSYSIHYTKLYDGSRHRSAVSR